MASMAAAPVQADSRFRLIGVVAPRASSAQAEGLALIATDGKPAKAYRVGREVDGELVLLGVHARGASLGPRGQPAQIDLQLPALPPPTTCTSEPTPLASPWCTPACGSPSQRGDVGALTAMFPPPAQRTLTWPFPVWV